MSDMNYSLCAVYPLRNKPDKLMFFRLADYNAYSKEYMPVLREDWTSEIEPKIIGAKPVEVRENLTEVRRWEYDKDDDRGRTISFREDASFYEFLFPKELSGVSYSDTKRIREVLLSGFSVDANTGSELLIAIGETTSRYAAIHCSKNKLKSVGDGVYCFSDNITDMLHATHFLLEYDIKKTDVIDTADIGITTIDGIAAPTRYFFRFSELPQSNGKFSLFAVDTYIPQYISRYLRKNKEVAGIGNADIRKIADAIQMILENREYMVEYFATTGYTQAQLEDQLSNYSADILSGLLSDHEIDEAIRTTLFNSERIRSLCLDAARTEWLHAKSEEKQRILDEIARLGEEQNQLKLANTDAAARAQLLEERQEKLDSNIADKTAELKKVQADIQEELRQFSENVAHNVALATVVQAYSTLVTKTQNETETGLIIMNSFNVVGVEEELGRKADFEEALSENLEEIGYGAEDSVDISQLLSFCIGNKLPLIVSNDGEQLANAVSAVFGMSQTGIVNIPSGFTDVEGLRGELTRAIAEHSAVVFYVTGAFDGYSAGLFNTLRFVAKESSSPLLFVMSLDGLDTNMLSRSVWESAMFLDDNSVIQYAGEPVLSMYESVCAFNSVYIEKEIKEKLKELKPFADLIDKRACIQLAKLLADTNESINNSAIGLQQLLIFAQVKGNVDSVGEILKNIQISDKAKRLIKDYL